jgi:hypothetical protein
VQDLLRDSVRSSGTVKVSYNGKLLELSQERIENPTDFARIYKIAMQNRGKDASKINPVNRAHLYVSFHLCFLYFGIFLCLHEWNKCITADSDLSDCTGC